MTGELAQRRCVRPRGEKLACDHRGRARVIHPQREERERVLQPLPKVRGHPLLEPGLAKLAEDAVEIADRCEVDRQRALGGAEGDLHAGVQAIP